MSILGAMMEAAFRLFSVSEKPVQDVVHLSQSQKCNTALINRGRVRQNIV